MSLFLPGSTGEVSSLAEALSAAPACTRGVRIICAYVAGLNRFERLAPHPSANMMGFFPPPPGLPLSWQTIPASYYGMDALIGRARPDIAVAHVSRPDAQGRVTLGLAADFAQTALGHASIRLAMVNPHLPTLLHGPRLELSGFTHVFETEETPLTVPPAAESAASAGILGHVARLIGDDCTLQAGIGRFPAQIIAALTDRRRLRIHSGMAHQAFRDLHAAGALHPDVPVTCASLGGDADFYRWLDGTDLVRLAPVSHTHAPATLAGLHRLVAINSAIEVDLAGGVNAEMVDGRKVSAPGGLPDFAHAAARSPGGLSIIVLPATDRSGWRSRIVRSLAGPPTLSGQDVDVVVTEHGLADLRGQDSDARRMRLASIASPEFRAALLAC